MKSRNSNVNLEFFVYAKFLKYINAVNSRFPDLASKQNGEKKVSRKYQGLNYNEASRGKRVIVWVYRGLNKRNRDSTVELLFGGQYLSHQLAISCRASNEVLVFPSNPTRCQKTPTFPLE